MERMRRIKRELAYKGVILHIYKDYMEFPDGHTAVWDFVEHKGAAAVVAACPDGDLLMVRQYRNALERDTLELPAGALDFAGEPALECAARELEEETGYKAGKIEWLMNLNTTVAFCNEKIGMYFATELMPSKQHLDPEEDVRVEKHNVQELVDMIFRGEITDGKTIAGILAYYYKIHRD